MSSSIPLLNKVIVMSDNFAKNSLEKGDPHPEPSLEHKVGVDWRFGEVVIPELHVALQSILVDCYPSRGRASPRRLLLQEMDQICVDLHGQDYIVFVLNEVS